MSKSVSKKVKSKKEQPVDHLSSVVNAYHQFIASINTVPAHKKCLEEAIRAFSTGMLWMCEGVKLASKK